MSILSEQYKNGELAELYSLYLAGGVGFENIVNWCTFNLKRLGKKDRTTPRKYYLYIYRNAAINRLNIESKYINVKNIGYERFMMIHTLSDSNLRTTYPAPHIVPAQSYFRDIRNDTLSKSFASIFELPENLYEELKQISLCHLKNQ